MTIIIACLLNKVSLRIERFGAAIGVFAAEELERGVFQVVFQHAQFSGVGKRDIQILVNAFLQLGVIDGPSDFYALFHVACHQVGAREIELAIIARTESVDAAVLQQTANDGNNFNVFGIAFNTGNQTRNAANEQRGFNASLGGFGNFVDDVLVGDGIGLERKAVGLAGFSKGDLFIDLVENHRLDLQRSNRKLLVSVGSVFQAHVAEELCGILADSFVGGDEAEVGVEPRGFLVVVARAELGNVLDAVFGVACDGADLRVNLEVVEAVDNVGASLFKALRPLDVVGLVEAGAQLEQRGNFLAVFCCGYQGFCQVGLAGKAVQRDFDREHRRVVCRFAEQVDEWIHAFVGIHKQGIALGYLFHDGSFLVKACWPLRRERFVGDVAC